MRFIIQLATFIIQPVCIIYLIINESILHAEYFILLDTADKRKIISRFALIFLLRNSEN